MFSANTSQVAAGGGALYVEDVMSTFLYTGNRPSTQTVTNGIDLSGKGGMVWVKNRASATFPNNTVFDTARGAGAGLITNSTAAQDTSYTQSFSSTGFDLGGDNGTNQSGITYVSWTFREAPKFFDVVTFTTDGTGAATVSHALGSTPAFVIVKRTDDTGLWFCWHTSLPSTNYYLFLNTTSAQTNSGGTWLTPSSTQVSFPSNSSTGALASSASYVMYVYASNAGGFGLTGTDNVISCGSFSTPAYAATVNLGYEPQWIMTKKADGAGDWEITDTMRGLTVTTNDAILYPNTSQAEAATQGPDPTSTGFKVDGYPIATYIYIAIRRGPMKVPTSGTDVFQPVKFISTASRQTVGSLPAVDMFFGRRMASIKDWGMSPRLTALFLKPNLTDAEDSSVTGYGDSAKFDLQNGSSFITAGSGDEFVTYNLRRSPSYMDVVCYTGTGSPTTQTHNLGVAPEMMIVRLRDNLASWAVYHQSLTASDRMILNDNSSTVTNSAYWNNTSPTSSVFTVGTNGNVNQSTKTVVAYLFATCAGVSKVGSYTGTATTKQIDCGFTGGARFVLIKRTDSTGDWYVWDSARGIVAGNDPYLLLNSTAAEVTNTDYVDTYSAGFEISSTAPAAINASGGTFIFLAIA